MWRLTAKVAASPMLLTSAFEGEVKDDRMQLLDGAHDR